MLHKKDGKRLAKRYDKPSQKKDFGSRSRRRQNLNRRHTQVLRGLNFPRNTDIGQIGHLWMGTI